MFHLYSGNRLEDLSVILGRILALSPPQNAFQLENILVQSPGMAQWLKIELAQQQGISAGITFPLPSTFVWQCFQQAIEDIPGQSEFNKAYVTWRLMRILTSRLSQTEFASLAWYLAADDSQMRLYQLCASIADVYDQYLVYRPDWIAAWEEDSQEDQQLNALTASQPWQAILWRDLVADVAELGGALYHRANLVEALRTATRSRQRPKGLPERIFVFGVSSLPPNTLDALRLMAEAGWIEMHLFVLNPCQYYWGDIVDKHYLGRMIKKQPQKKGLLIDTLHLEANPLLASWGRLGRDYIVQLLDMADQQLDVFEDFVEPDASAPLQSSSLLQWIQQDIFTLDNHGAEQERRLVNKDSYYKHPLDQQDQSVRIHACHSALREVEVLHDQLLAMFAADPELTPKDIIVMLPDVNQYSPFVKSVFARQAYNKRIPFALIDQMAGAENPVIDAYIELLSLADSRCTLSELISILEVPAVLERFELTPQALERIRQWCSEAGIRWGLDPQTAEQWILPAQPHNTWENGLRRMLLGYAVGHDTVWAELLSYGDVEGLEAELVGKLAEFLTAIALALQAMQQVRRPDDWVHFLYELHECFFILPEQDSFPQILMQQVDQMATEWRTAHYHEPVELAVLRQQLIPRLQASQGSQRFLAGRVNFCTLMPMRSVPFKVVCLLGLNEGVYPRSVVPVGFDLMVGHYRSGDRSRREDDKYLFLEALMSARKRLYISYMGRNIRDNSELNPSILVSELMEYALQSSAFEEDLPLPPEASQAKLLKALLVVHPLQPFNRDYYLAHSNKDLFSYQDIWLDALASRLQEVPSIEALPSLEAANEELELDQLVRFFTHPARFFYQHRLKAYLSIRQTEELEDEPFVLNNLSAFDFRQQALSVYDGQSSATATIAASSLDDLQQRMLLSGQFPYGAFGKMALKELLAQCSAMAADSPPQPSVAPASIDIQLTLAGYQLTGWLSQWREGLRLVRHLGVLSARIKMKAWLEHLAINAQGLEVDTQLLAFVTNQSTDTGSFVFASMAPAEASRLLEQYVLAYDTGLNMPLPLPAKAADKWSSECLNDKYDDPEARAWDKALEGYHETFTGFAEGQDDYWQRCYPELKSVQAEFIRLSEALWLPLNQHLEDMP